MELRIKKTITLLTVCMLVFVSFSVVMVYAPRPEDGVSPFQNVEVVNTDPIPVDVTTTTLNVNADVSGWLHTTKSGDIKGVSVPSTISGVDVLDEETDGYRKVTLVINNTGAIDCAFAVRFRLSGPIIYDLAFLIVNAGDLFVETYDVQGTDIILTGQSAGFDPAIVDIHYFITT